MTIDVCLTPCNRNYFLYEEQEEEILWMKKQLRLHLKEDQRKLDVLQKMNSSTQDLQKAIGTDVVNNYLRLAYLDALLFDVQALKASAPFFLP